MSSTSWHRDKFLTHLGIYKGALLQVMLSCATFGPYDALSCKLYITETRIYKWHHHSHLSLSGQQPTWPFSCQHWYLQIPLAILFCVLPYPCSPYGTTATAYQRYWVNRIVVSKGSTAHRSTRFAYRSTHHKHHGYRDKRPVQPDNYGV